MKRKIIALTGGIGSGKSTVAAILVQRGFAVVDCDQIARQVADDSALISEVVSLLGKDAARDGKLDRKYIREKVFADAQLSKEYGQLFYGKVKSRLEDALKSELGHVFVEIAVLDAFDFCWDEVWCVVADSNQRIERVVSRDGVSSSNVQNIMAVQKHYNADRIITNDGTLSQLEEVVVNCLSAAQLC